MVYFDQSNFDGISKKLNEFSAQLASSGVWISTTTTTTCVMCLTSVLLRSFFFFFFLLAQSDQAGKALSADGRDAGLVDSLIGTLKDTSRYHATTFASDELRVVSKLLTWPAPMRFPGTAVTSFLFLGSLRRMCVSCRHTNHHRRRIRDAQCWTW